MRTEAMRCISTISFSDNWDLPLRKGGMFSLKGLCNWNLKHICYRPILAMKKIFKVTCGSVHEVYRDVYKGILTMEELYACSSCFTGALANDL